MFPLESRPRKITFCVVLFPLQDLQSEIESHKDVVASLNATGQKLLGTLENQDEALMLHRRLEEMNTRWNTLKHRSIAIR